MDVPAFEEALYEFFDTFGIDEDNLSFDVFEKKNIPTQMGFKKLMRQLIL